MVGMSYPPNSTISVKAEYDPCRGCTPPPHTFHAKRTARILIETRNRSTALRGPEETISWSKRHDPDEWSSPE